MLALRHYHYQLEIERDSDNERIIVDRGAIGPSTDYDNNVDVRHHAEIMLGKIQSILKVKQIVMCLVIQ